MVSCYHLILVLIAANANKNIQILAFLLSSKAKFLVLSSSCEIAGSAVFSKVQWAPISSLLYLKSAVVLKWQETHLATWNILKSFLTATDYLILKFLDCNWSEYFKDNIRSVLESFPLHYQFLVFFIVHSYRYGDLSAFLSYVVSSPKKLIRSRNL